MIRSAEIDEQRPVRWVMGLDGVPTLTNRARLDLIRRAHDHNSRLEQDLPRIDDQGQERRGRQ